MIRAQANCCHPQMHKHAPTDPAESWICWG
jgi:hypothetical protein